MSLMRCWSLLLFILCLSSVACIKEQQESSTKKTNVLLIISDDQRYDQVSPAVMPTLNAKIIEKGIFFENAYITNPACCPSRSAILTGKYNSKNKVYGNRYPLSDSQETISHLLKRQNYFTGLIGKFLNSWDGTPRPEYDYWFSHTGALVNYKNPTFNDNGTVKKFPGYVTDVFTDAITTFLKKATASKKPFFLVFTPNAPHEPAIPSQKYAKSFADYAPYRPPNFAKVPDKKPAHMTKGRPFNTKAQAKVDAFRLNQLRTLQSLDDTIAATLTVLEEEQLIEDTLIIYISDNGVFLGEFGLRGKSKVYEPAIHVPMAIRYDPITNNQAIRSSSLVGNIDIAASILDILKLPRDASMDGHSIVPILKDPSAEIRDSLLIESWGNRGLRGNKGFIALHTPHSIYIENEDDVNEFYDLKEDPYQLNNLAFTALPKTARQLQKELHTLVSTLRGSVHYRIEAEEVAGFRQRKK